MCFEKVTFLMGNEETIRNMPERKPLEAFDEKTLAFLSSLSEKLKETTEKESEIRGFSFWARRSSLEEMKKKYSSEKRIGRGVSFHITPKNMPLVFAFSMSAALLAGNCVIVKLPNKQGPFDETVIDALNTCAEGNEFADRIAVIRYDNNEETTSCLSAMSDTRAVWGSDETVNTVSRIPLKPGGEDLLFSNRYSFSIIDSSSLILKNEADIAARSFYSDTYRYDQNACSSPRVIFFKGSDEECIIAEDLFFSELGNLVSKNGYDIGTDMIMKKLVSAYQCAAVYPKTELDLKNTMMMRARVTKPDYNIWSLTHPAGLFICIHVRETEQIRQVLTDSLQTVTVYGSGREELEWLGNDSRIKRIVPFGNAVSFSLTWDGMDLIEKMTKFR